jgi:hypothetical protein
MLFVRGAALLVIAAACQAVLADDYYSMTGNEKNIPETPAITNGEYATDFGDCNCDENGIAFVGAAGLDSFGCIADDGRTNNFGAVTGLNSAVPLFGLKDRGFGWQTGVSYGVYDFEGRFGNQEQTCQQQVFVTTGFFRKAKCDERVSFGLVYDWMFNTDYGVGAVDPTLGQWRGQVEYAMSDSNAIGVRGAVRDNIARNQGTYFQRAALYEHQAVTHGEVFWHHAFCESRADTYLYMGLTQNDRLSGDGSLYDWLVGLSGEVPMSDRLTLYANAQFVHPTGVAGSTSAADMGYNVGMGVAYYFGGCARARSIHGPHGPYLPIANNSSFIVDGVVHPGVL